MSVNEIIFFRLKRLTFFECICYQYQAHEPPATSPLPDLRVDFFSEPMDNVQKRHSYVEITMKQMSASPSDISPSMSNTNISIGSTGNSTGINVTSNPMDETTTTVTCTTQTPRATIVVQQVNVKRYVITANSFWQTPHSLHSKRPELNSSQKKNQNNSRL